MSADYPFLSILRDTGEVFEVCRDPGAYGSVVGYFDDIGLAAKAIAKLDGTGNIFVTLNSVNPALIARAANKLIKLTKDNGRTKDQEVKVDSWFLVDIDPRRPKGISSTQEELDAAINTARSICAWLKGEGVPMSSIVAAISGNGAYVLVRLPDYEVTKERTNLKERLLKFFADKFDDDVVEIDRVVFNPARLIGAVGAMKVKGDSIPERPHRRSQLLMVAGQKFDPSISYQVEPFDLYALATEKWLPKKEERPNPAPPRVNSNGHFNMLEHLGELSEVRDTGREYWYATCPACQGPEKLHVHKITGAYGCFHKDKCTTEAIRESMGYPKHISRYSASKNGHNEPSHAEEQDPRRSRVWPDSLSSDAYYGLAGDIVRLIEPDTEADPAAILTQNMTSFCSVVGRNPYFVVEEDRHYLNLNVAIVGPTGKGRKGTSFGRVRRVYGQIDEYWTQERIQSGLSSGEGLIWAVRDPIERREPIREKGKITGYQTQVTDEGVEDKRLLALEPELGSLLRVLGREGNTLSAVGRQAWDSGNLRTLTKNSPVKATGAHISIIGHITRDELRRYLDTTVVANGFANRFLFVCARRSKLLPEGGRPTPLNSMVARLDQAIRLARKTGEMKRDAEARALWWEEYPALSEPKPGLYGAVTGRAEAQVTRLSCLYALMDCSPEIQLPHLKAALALWRYCQASAKFIFGDTIGDPMADGLLTALRAAPDGLTRTDLTNILGRNRSAAAIGRALESLAELGMATCTREKQEGQGRPVERWSALRIQAPEQYEINEKNEINREATSEGGINSFNSFISYPDTSADPACSVVDGPVDPDPEGVY